MPLSEDFFIISYRQRVLCYSSIKGFLYYSISTQDSLLLLSQEISLYYSGPREDFFIIPLSEDFFIIPLSENFFIIAVRQRIS